jgi:hypothetical protein
LLELIVTVPRWDLGLGTFRGYGHTTIDTGGGNQSSGFLGLFEKLKLGRELNVKVVLTASVV